MRRALVLGVNGQDGSYLAEALLTRNFAVTGVGRAERSRYPFVSDRFTYAACDLRDRAGLATVVERAEPDFAFHVAAVHGAAGFAYEGRWDDLIAVNVSALETVLEYGRVRNPAVRVVYAGSAKVFPTPLAGVIDEETPQRATCLYSLSKLASRDLQRYYRESYGIRSTNVILFNHESPRRDNTFLLPQLAEARLRAESDQGFQLRVRNLNFWIDWSSAVEFMDILVDLAESSDAPEIVLASGVTSNARDLVSSLFQARGLDLESHVIETAPAANAGPHFRVDVSLLVNAIGRRPAVSVFDIVDKMNAASLVAA